MPGGPHSSTEVPGRPLHLPRPVVELGHRRNWSQVVDTEVDTAVQVADTVVGRSSVADWDLVDIGCSRQEVPVADGQVEHWDLVGTSGDSKADVAPESA